MIFPELGPKYFSEEHKDVLSRMETFYAQSLTHNQTFWAEADIDTRFESGDQTIWRDLYGNLPLSQRKQFNFNRIRRVVNMIDGFQRRNRKSTIVIPVENSDEETANQFSKVMMWANRSDGVLDTVSGAFRGALITGMNLMHVWMDYRNDPISGNIRVDNCSYNSFLIDPFFKKTDLSDCNGLWKRSFVTRLEAISLLPDKKEEILELPGTEGAGRDNKFEFMPQSYNYGYSNLMAYDEFYYRDYRSQRMLVDTQTGESMEWRGDDDKLKQFLNTYPQVTILKQDIPTVKLAIVVQGAVLYDGPNPLGIDTYPFVPVLGYYSPEMPYFPYRVQGVVRGLRDAQYLYNRRRAIELDILESQVNSGWVFKENALVNPKDVFMSGQGRSIALKEEAQISDVQRIEAPQVPPSMIQLSELLAQEVNQISGVNEELLGSAVDDKAGILSMLRQGAGLTTLQSLFDQLDQSQKLLGKIMIDVIQQSFTPGKVKRIIEEEPTPQFYNKAFGRYDAAIEEGLDTSTQKSMAFAQLLHLREIGINIPDNVLLENLNVQNKKQLIEAVEAQNKKQSELEQMQLQSTQKEIESRIDLANARAMADRGLGIERISRVEENESLSVERLAEAQKDRMSGLLDMVRAAKELEGIDIDQIRRMIELANLIKIQEDEGTAKSVEQPTNVQPEGEISQQ